MWHTWSWIRVPLMSIHMYKYVDHMAWQPFWPPRRQQVSHHRWIWVIYSMQVMKHASGDPPWLCNPVRTSPGVQNKVNKKCLIIVNSPTDLNFLSISYRLRKWLICIELPLTPASAPFCNMTSLTWNAINSFALCGFPLTTVLVF